MEIFKHIQQRQKITKYFLKDCTLFMQLIKTMSFQTRCIPIKCIPNKCIQMRCILCMRIHAWTPASVIGICVKIRYIFSFLSFGERKNYFDSLTPKIVQNMIWLNHIFLISHQHFSLEFENRLSSYNRGQQRNGSIIHDVTSAKYNKETKFSHII